MDFRKVVTFLLLCVLPAAAQNPRGRAEATVKGRKISIDYGRPSLQGRDMIAMAKPGMVWRLGMDEATEIQSMRMNSMDSVQPETFQLDYIL